MFIEPKAQKDYFAPAERDTPFASTTHRPYGAPDVFVCRSYKHFVALRRGFVARALETGNKVEWMKYICLGYLEPGKFEGMADSERNAAFDECFEYNDHLRANGHLVAEVPL